MSLGFPQLVDSNLGEYSCSCSNTLFILLGSVEAEIRKKPSMPPGSVATAGSHCSGWHQNPAEGAHRMVRRERLDAQIS